SRSSGGFSGALGVASVRPLMLQVCCAAASRLTRAPPTAGLPRGAAHNEAVGGREGADALPRVERRVRLVGGPRRGGAPRRATNRIGARSLVRVNVKGHWASRSGDAVREPAREPWRLPTREPVRDELLDVVPLGAVDDAEAATVFSSPPAPRSRRVLFESPE